MGAERARHEGSWQLQEAKARFSELVRRAVAEGPQHVSIRGEKTAVVLSEDAYRRLNTLHRKALVTPNVADFADLDVRIIDPWNLR